MFYFIYNGCFCNIFLLWALVSAALEQLWSVALAQYPLCPLAAFSGPLKSEVNSKNCLNYLWKKFNQMLSQLIFVDLNHKCIHYSELCAAMINISFVRLFISCWVFGLPLKVLVILKQLLMRSYLPLPYRETGMFMKLPQSSSHWAQCE